MQTDARSTATPFFLPFHGRRGVEKLRILPVPPPGVLMGSRTAPLHDVSEAIARLRAVGLIAERGQGPDLHILGGTSVAGDEEIPVFQNSFGIFIDATGQIMAVVSDRGQLATEMPVRTLEAAVDTIIHVYKERGALPPATARR